MSNQNDTYYDLHTSGIGFVNRFRKVQPEQGEAYYGITIAALRGKPNAEGKVAKTYIDCNVVGDDAIEMCRQLEPFFEGDAEPKVMVSFTIGDLEQRAFQYKRGERKGQTGYALKGRLFDIKWFKANGGETVYSTAEIERKKQLAEQDASSTEADSEPAELPNEVRLVKEDPYYDQREQQLIAQGYSYIGGGLWSLAGAV